MSVTEFNEKYKDYLEEGHYGLDISNSKVVEYLDKVFEELIKYPNFQYSQIKLKWNQSSVYTNLPPMIGRIIESGIEKNIDQMMIMIQEEYVKGE
jgi:hypothetical protein